MYDCFAIERSLAELGKCYEGNPWEPDNKNPPVEAGFYLQQLTGCQAMHKQSRSHHDQATGEHHRR